ncbi:MAG TPA: hypothetical protein HA348_02325, partial [Thermoplasmata archaeon]|nr:hypothetical protein [Thermoplasmata archaeon]
LSQIANQKKGERRKCKKRVICLVSILLIGALFLGSCGCIKESKKEEKEETPLGKMEIPSNWKWYESEEGGFKIRYPENWREWEQITLSGKELLFIIFPPDLDPFTICVHSEKSKSNYEAAQNFIKNGPKLYSNFQCEEFTNFTLDNVPAIKMISAFEYKHPMNESKEMHCRRLCILAQKGQKQYTLQYNWAPDNINETSEGFEYYLKQVNQMVSSFRFL